MGLLETTSRSLSINPLYSITKAGDIKTFGAAGFEFFTIGEKSFICSANFWDGIDRDMKANSQIFEVFSYEGELNFQPLDEFTTMGAHGCDYFSMKNQHYGKKSLLYKCNILSKFVMFHLNLVTVPSYYGCKENERTDSCKNVHVLRYHDNQNRFEVVNEISSRGPSQTGGV